MDIISLFSGVGGLDWGFVREGFKVVDMCEIDADSCQTYNYNFETDFTLSDIRQRRFCLNNDGIVLSGPPCQDFTIVQSRDRLGMKGSQGNLIFEFVRSIGEISPKMFVFENVIGFKSVNKGRAFENFVEVLSSDYKLSQKILNFADYGVPQKRRRIFVVGIRKPTSKEYVFPFPTCDENRYVTVEEAFRNLPEVNNEKRIISDLMRERLESIPAGGNNDDAPKRLQVNQHRAYTYRRLHPKQPAYTLIGRGGGGSEEYHFDEPRPLTNRERARLQGFPDEFIFFGDYGSIRSQICNAVSPVISQILAKSIKTLVLET